MPKTKVATKSASATVNMKVAEATSLILALDVAAIVLGYLGQRVKIPAFLSAQEVAGNLIRVLHAAERAGQEELRELEERHGSRNPARRKGRQEKKR